jgi:hypothetical protein
MGISSFGFGRNGKRMTMTNTLRSRRDRPGHAFRRSAVGCLRGLVAIVLLGAAGVADAAPGDYKAQRFDVVARAVNGSLDVTEAIAFEFQSGSFTSVWREIPVSRTDGITILDAAMDGQPMAAGDGPGHFSVTRRDGKLRVEWRFAEVAPSVHRFTLHYLARGVVYRDGGYDIVRWQALPSEHKYAIDASRVRFEPEGADFAPPESRRVAAVEAKATSEGVTIEASGIRSNGWITAELRYGAGVLIAQEPEWRQRSARARETAPKWAMGGATIFVAGVFLLWVMRQDYAAPADPPSETAAIEPPAPLPAALASVLTAKGGVSGFQSSATLLDLADRGVLRVREVPRTLGRSYDVVQVPGSYDLEPHELEALTIAFADRADEVTMAKARGRLVRQSRRFIAAVNADLAARGLIDPDRKAARDRQIRFSLFMVVAAPLCAAGVAPLVPRYQGWPFLVPLGILVAGIVGLVMGVTITPLSDQGLEEAARWRGFRRHLRSLVSRDDQGAAPLPSRWLVYAVGAGLGSQWARYLKRHPGTAPPWFVAAGADPGRAFAAFIGSGAATGADGSGTVAGGGAAAAGGGGSGAG